MMGMTRFMLVQLRLRLLVPGDPQAHLRTKGRPVHVSNASRCPAYSLLLRLTKVAMMPVMSEEERCRLCGCQLNRVKYGGPTIEGRSAASKHHYVAERFFGRSKNRRGVETEGIFTALSSPWGDERQSDIFCYECHELLLHNPVHLREDIDRFTEWFRCGTFRKR